jgi:hypothetical protein
LLGYKVKVRHADLTTYSEDTTNCNGSTSSIFTNAACSIPLATLITTPYSLTKGVSVFAVVIAYNLYGDSIESLPGNGAKIVLVPDAPLSLANNPAITNAYQIGLVWLEGLSNGGDPVAYYTVSYEIGSSGSYSVVAA